MFAMWTHVDAEHLTAPVQIAHMVHIMDVDLCAKKMGLYSLYLLHFVPCPIKSVRFCYYHKCEIAKIMGENWKLVKDTSIWAA